MMENDRRKQRERDEAIERLPSSPPQKKEQNTSRKIDQNLSSKQTKRNKKLNFLKQIKS